MVRFLRIVFSILLFVGIATVVGAYLVVQRYGDDLPDYAQLVDYEPPVTTRVHAGDGRLLAEYAIQHRLFVPIDVIPQNVVNAFLAAEDKNFYAHPGIDATSVVRAAVTNLVQMASGRRPVGGSTITQQVAKNFLLTNEVSIDRKIKEALLAFRIEQALTKNRILELYLNEIYLGYGSYGVAAAALNYFNKSLDDLTLAEAAFLAALPKAPNNYNPVTRTQAAKDRRDWVIDRMLEDRRIERPQAEEAWREPLVVRKRDETEYVTAAWFSEDVRREIVARFGDRALYEGGLSVRATLDMRMQRLGEAALRDGLATYDRRHGWRGPIAQIGGGPGWQDRLANL
ncbi:MAG: transglycosylase domain-containing protein, partial [Alphaproteobacteria bacterium]